MLSSLFVLKRRGIFVENFCLKFVNNQPFFSLFVCFIKKRSLDLINLKNISKPN
jgi:hypothetical protein